MAEDPLRSAVDAIRSRLNTEIESQLALLSTRQQEELETARRTAEADAEHRWGAKVDAVRAEWTSRLQSEVAAARAEAERRMVAESMRLRVEAEQAAAESAARAREELERAIAEERQRSAAQLSSERQQLQRENESLRQQLEAARVQLDTLQQEVERAAAARREAESALEQERLVRKEDARRQEEITRAAAEARVAERQAQLHVVERLLAAIRSLDAARSLSDVLSALTAAAANEAPRVALFVVNGSELRGWKTAGFEAAAAALRAGADDDGLLGEVMRRREPVVTADGDGPAPPAFASLPSGRAAMAVPLLVGAQPVAVLYADDASEEPARAPASWPEAVQILGRHASVNLAHLTAARAADAMRRSLVPPAAAPAGASAGTPANDPNGARRYARLLVSEIKLYNEAAVRVGRQNRDLLRRLQPEIERARKLYEQRISPAVDSKGALFQQELVQTLADGDPSLLGSPA